MATKSRPPPSVEEKLQDQEARSHRSAELLDAAAGATAGAIAGAMAGPIGAATGAVIGAAIGAAVAHAMEAHELENARHDAALDDIGRDDPVAQARASAAPPEVDEGEPGGGDEAASPEATPIGEALKDL